MWWDCAHHPRCLSLQQSLRVQYDRDACNLLKLAYGIKFNLLCRIVQHTGTSKLRAVSTTLDRQSLEFRCQHYCRRISSRPWCCLGLNRRTDTTGGLARQRACVVFVCLWRCQVGRNANGTCFFAETPKKVQPGVAVYECCCGRAMVCTQEWRGSAATKHTYISTTYVLMPAAALLS